jgi:hypothetical protein
MIFGSSGDGGYFVASSFEEFDHYIKPELSREAKIRQRNAAMKAKANRLFSPQAGLFS